MTHFALSRRLFLAGAGLTLAAPQLAVAQTGGPKKLVLIILRGGMDGLGVVPPYADPRYVELRESIALAPPGAEQGALKLDAMFGLHPELENLHALYSAGEVAILHAAAGPYRDRSHFDAQDKLESGAPGGVRDGWLNRALQVMPKSGAPNAVAVAASAPLILQGDAETTSWSPNVLPETDQDTNERLLALYQDDPMFAESFAAALNLGETMSGAMGRGGRRTPDVDLVHQAAALLTADGAADIAVLSLSGWDTHRRQGGAQGALGSRLRPFDRSIAELKRKLGPVWSQTVVLAVTEFGRTARVNGTAGTDHGTAGAAFLFGGAIRGGRMLGDWPGLGSLYEDRDLLPANDIRALFKGVLRDHLGVDRAELDRYVFPGSGDAAPIEGLVS